jgi:hypothetical protein
VHTVVHIRVNVIVLTRPDADTQEESAPANLRLVLVGLHGSPY